MRESHKKIIDAVIEKANKLCPESLSLIGVYGSVCTKDEYAKSDLDLLIVIDDDRGWQLSKTFILDDEEIGYDIYCTTWEMLEDDAKCPHAHISKLMDSEIVYKRDDAVLKRLEGLRDKAKARLNSEEIHESVGKIRDYICREYGYVVSMETLGQKRNHAAYMISLCLDAVMLWNGRYYKRGVKHTFEELEGLSIPENFKENIEDIITSESSSQLIDNATKLLKSVTAHIEHSKEKPAPAKEQIAGSYEEMFSNWRNKMYDAAERGDIFSSFMNLASLQAMLDDIGSEVKIQSYDLMEAFDHKKLLKNAETYDNALKQYEKEYEAVGIKAQSYKNVDEFVADYLKS